jgi:hypothetical protein
MEIIQQFSSEVTNNIDTCNFIEIIVLENFEVKNGVLGLDRDTLLSIVKFLDSSTIKKVRVNILFIFFLVYWD